jgi:hypothetical protein
MDQFYKHRDAVKDDLPFICNFPQDENELYFMFPKALFPLTVEQLQSSINSRTDSTVIYSGETVLGFANFYEVVEGDYCSIGNVIINPVFRGKWVGTFLIKTMEDQVINNFLRQLDDEIKKLSPFKDSQT